MQRSLIVPLALVLAASASTGCQNQVAHGDAELAKRAATQSPAPEQQQVLRPVRYSMKVHSGSSGALLPTNIDTQIAPLLAKFDQWDQVTRVVIVGHTDAEGSAESNLLLSIRRANALAERLVDYGVPEGALEVDGRGEESPIGSNSSISGKQLNRRVEVIAEGLQAINELPRIGQN